MPRASREAEEFESFYFSFLDILACTIGALAFILLMIVLSTQDLVERKPTDVETEVEAVDIPELEARPEVQEEELEVSRRRLEELGAEQARLEDRNIELEAQVDQLQAYEAQVEALARVNAELTEAVAAVQRELALARRESEEGELRVEELLARLEEEHRQREQLEEQLKPPESAAEVPVPAPEDTDAPPEVPEPGPEVPEPGTEEPERAPEVEDPSPEELLATPSLHPTSGEAVEPQPPLLPNLERRPITSGPDGVILGGARAPIAATDPAFAQAVRQFLRYCDPARQILWWARLPGGDSVHVAALSAVTSARAEWGRGLVADADRDQPRFQTGEGSTLAIDADGDGADDTFYLADPGHWAWTRLYVDTIPARPGLEECYGDFDPRTARWRVRIVDSDGDGRYDLRLLDDDPTDQDWEVVEVDPVGLGPLVGVSGEVRELLRLPATAGAAELAAAGRASRPTCWARYEDVDGDGVFDDKRIDTNPNPDFWGERLAGFDPDFKRWTERSVDTDGDGAFDLRWRDVDPSDDVWDELWVRGREGWARDARLEAPPGDRRVARREVRDASPTLGYFWRVITSLDASGRRLRRDRLDDRDGDGRWDARSADTDGDGKWDALWVDSDGDGQWDQRQRGRERGQWSETLLDADRDGRWDPPTR